MLSELIEANTALVSEFKIREEEEQKSSEQHNIDNNFTIAINNVRQTVVHLCEVKKCVDFEETQNTNQTILEMLKICKECAEQKHVKAADTAKINGLNRNINSSLFEEWRQYHIKKTSSIREILGIARTLSSNEATTLMNDINAAAKWDVASKEVVRMTEAIGEANDLIGQLELNEAIVDFLKKMVEHRASLEDLTREVFDWIEKENLKKRVKLSF